ncbi:MAG: hypothetical protein K2X43_01290 [Hyphomonadaceae bacterium]|jgi:hypothetical protein|nr:hypothetical protein [Hyphomonadaceae bacterium]
MSTTDAIVTAAYKAINAIDIAEASPSPAETTEGIRRLNAMVSSWAGQGLAVIEQTIKATVTSGSPTLADIANTSTLAPGLNVSGTGIPANTRILSVDSATQVTLNQNATASGSAVSLAVTPIPFEAKFEQGVIALLAMRLAMSAEDIPPWVAQDARDGWNALQANFMPVPKATFDPALVYTTVPRRQILLR